MWYARLILVSWTLSYLIYSANSYSYSSNNGYTLIYFTGNDNIYIPSSMQVNFLLVAGGGGGGSTGGGTCEGTGGGGGGGVSAGVITLYGGSSYSITVGGGGGSGSSGGTSQIFGAGVLIYVNGGGAGGGNLGGSGGGGTGVGNPQGGGGSSPGGCVAGCNSISFYGNNGGQGDHYGYGGGGGGAGSGPPDGHSGGAALYWVYANDYFGAGGGGGEGNGDFWSCCGGGNSGRNGGTYAGYGNIPGSCGGDYTKQSTGAGGGGSGCHCGRGGQAAGGVVIFAYCAAGTYQSGTSCVSCPAGTASSASGLQGSGTCATCPAGYYSNSGASSCIACPAGQYSSSPGSGSCSSCPAGTYSTNSGSSSCFQCPKGTYNPNTGSNSEGYCTACPPGTANANYAGSSLSSCVPCAAGYYSPSSGTVTCTACPVGHFSPSPGLTSCTVCPAVAYYTPSGSSACHCNPVQTSVNLCSILFQSDSTLNSYTTSYTNKTDVYGVSQYLLSTLKIEVDINGDGIITRTEITAALGYRSIQSSALASIPVWNNANYTDSVPVTDLFNDAISFFTTSPKHTFDGSGADDLLSITSTYPNTNWNSDLCYQYDSFLNPSYSPVSVSWQYSQPYSNIVAGGLAQVCGYVNGRLINDFDVSYNLNDGYQTNLLDNGADSDLSFKRVYCLVTWHNDFTTQYQCSLGLFYDGTPIDLTPSLTTDGVVFQYFDTSSAEKEFDIFSGLYGSSDDLKHLVVGIPYPSKGCGRTSRHISFADKTVINNVGQIVEYSIKSIQTKNGNDPNPTYQYSKSTTKPYRIPFLSRITGSVRTKSRVGVEGVTITLCHIDPVTAQNNKDPTYCPYLNLTTDARGLFESEIRVSDVNWTRLEEHFNVSASYTEYLTLDGSGQAIQHVFAPSHHIVSLRQVLTSSLSIIDETAVSIFGTVKFDPTNTNGIDCRFPNVPVNLVHGNGLMDNTTSAADGTFNFTISKGDTVYVYIPDFHGYSWDSHVQSVSPLLSANSAAAAAMPPPTAAPIALPDYIATSEYPQTTGQGVGLYDYNWILTAFNGRSINFPTKIVPDQFVSSPGMPIFGNQSAGTYNFKTTFELPNYADYSCLSIPISIRATVLVRYISLNNYLQVVSCTKCNQTLTNLQASNSLNVVVYYSGHEAGVEVSVVFFAPLVQCPKVLPLSTGVSAGPTDYNWVITSAPDNRYVPYFPSILKAEPNYWYSAPSSVSAGWISSDASGVDVVGVYVYQYTFTLPYYENYTCIHLPITLASKYIITDIEINGNNPNRNTWAFVSPNTTTTISLTPFLLQTNVLRITVRSSRSSETGFFAEFGDVRENQCVQYWPQSTGLSSYKYWDNNWIVSYNSSAVGQAVIASTIPSNWIPESVEGKWVGLTRNAYTSTDNKGNYTFHTHFKLEGFDNLQCLQIRFNFSTSCGLSEIVLNNHVLYNCSAPSYCGITANKFASFKLSQYLMPFNDLQITVRNSGNVATGILVEFESTPLIQQCFTDLPRSTGDGEIGDSDNNWLVKRSTQFKTVFADIVPSSAPWNTYGAKWISTDNLGLRNSTSDITEYVFQTAFNLPSYANYRCINLPLLVGVTGRLKQIKVNGKAISFLPTLNAFDTMAPSPIPSTIPSAPTCAPTFNPSIAPSAVPSKTPTYIPSFGPSFRPSTAPSSVIPSVSPSYQPSNSPSTIVPSYFPSLFPTQCPSYRPSYRPSYSPSTILPSFLPSTLPSQAPSNKPSYKPSLSPSTIMPSTGLTAVPTQTPSKKPSLLPSVAPSTFPPTVRSTLIPSQTPTAKPSLFPTRPSHLPTREPSFTPSSMQPTFTSTSTPTTKPFFSPTRKPTFLLTAKPSTLLPTIVPTIEPTLESTVLPTLKPIIKKTTKPTKPKTPSAISTTFPTEAPTIEPTMEPSVKTSAKKSVKPSKAKSSFAEGVFEEYSSTFSPTEEPSPFPTESPTTLIEKDLLIYYPFTADSLNGSNVGNLATGVLVFNATLQNSAQVKNSELILNAAQSQYLEINSFTTGSNGLSIAVWFKSSASSPNAHIIDFGNGFGVNNIKINCNGIGKNTLWFIVADGSKFNNWAYTSKNVNDGVWHHIVWVFDPSNSWTIYLDMVQIAQLSFAYPDSIPRWYNYIGQSSQPGAAYLNGAVADFRLYDRVLDSTEIDPIYEYGIPLEARKPTGHPTNSPSTVPSISPSRFTPTAGPTAVPSMIPTTRCPTYKPSTVPSSIIPSTFPTIAPSCTPTFLPSATPTFEPTSRPSAAPTYLPSFVPTQVPTFVPTYRPTYQPSMKPSYRPTATPTQKPTYVPSFFPTYMFQSQLYSLLNYNFTFGLFPFSIDNLQPSNVIEFYVENDTIPNANIGLAVKFGDIQADSCIPWPKSTAASQSFSFDFNWMITSFTDDNLNIIATLYPSTVYNNTGRIGTPPSLNDIIGVFNFQNTFTLPNFVNYSCPKIPFHVKGSDYVTYIRINGFSVFECSWTSSCGSFLATNRTFVLHSMLQALNTLDIGVHAGGFHGAKLSVNFMSPYDQCNLQAPKSSGGVMIKSPVVSPQVTALSLGASSLSSCAPFSTIATSSSLDYSWMISSAPDSRQIPYFAYVMPSIPVGWYIPSDGKGWITSNNSACDVSGLYTFRLSFSLSFYSNFSCIQLPINIAAVGRVVHINLNGQILNINTSAILSASLVQFNLQSRYLREINSLEVVISTGKGSYSSPALFIEVGQLLFDACVTSWPQSTGSAVYSNTLDSSWTISATLSSGSSLAVQQAIVADFVPSTWIGNGSYGGKWIGLTANSSANGVPDGYYTFQTSFFLLGFNNISDASLILPFTIASPNAVAAIKLNGQVLYDCATQNNCGVSNGKVIALLINKYFSSFNVFDIILAVTGNGAEPLGLLVEFGDMYPQATGNTGYTFDLSWLITSAPYVLSKPLLAHKLPHGNHKWVNLRNDSIYWVSPSNKSSGIAAAGFYTYQTTFAVGVFPNYTCLELPLMVSASDQVQLITLNGHQIYQCCTPSISYHSLVTISLLSHLQAINILQIRVLNQHHAPTGLAASFGDIAFKCTSAPSLSPSVRPPSWTASPSNPTKSPSRSPTLRPAILPTLSPSDQPTVYPSYVFACPPGYSRWETICIEHSKFDIVCPLGYQFDPNYLGCIPKSLSPSEEPTIAPSFNPSEEPTIEPTRPTGTPTTLPTEAPTLLPTFSPSAFPTISSPPTLYPTFDIINFNAPLLLHTYKFNDAFGEGGAPLYAQLIDSTSGDYAMLGGDGVTIENGNAVFTYDPITKYVPHIILPHDFLGPAEVITVEAWVRYDATCPSNSILFSFGPLIFSNSLVLSRHHESVDMYIAVVYTMQTSPPSGKLYIDGKRANVDPYKDIVFYHPQACYIGSNNQNTSGMVANIDEFRVWSGELPAHIIYSHYLTGVDPSHITLSSFFTIADVKVDFYATSMQLVNIGIFGGHSKIPMFGEETVFTAQAYKAMCNYSVQFAMDPAASSFTQFIPAMNYTVTLTQSASNGPTFSDCGNAVECFCDPVHKNPITYLSELGELSQDLRITDVDDSIYYINYTYHTGVCFEALNSLQFATNEGPCFRADATVLKKHQNWTLQFVLFELYPEGNDWVQASPKPVYALTDYTVDNATIVITDLVSARKSPQRFNYLNNFTIIPPSVVPSPLGLNYTITAGTLFRVLLIPGHLMSELNDWIRRRTMYLLAQIFQFILL